MYRTSKQRSRSLIFIATNVVGLSLIIVTSGCSKERAPVAGTGILVGEVTHHRALAQVRLSKRDHLVDNDLEGVAGVVEFALTPVIDGKEQTSQTERVVFDATPERDFIARASWDNLLAGTRYICRSRIGLNEENLNTGPTATFKTLPGPTGSDPISFVVATCMNYAKFHGDNRIDRAIHLQLNATELPEPYSGPDKHLGYPALKTILDIEPDFFVGAGDTIYYDTPKEPRAETVTEMRQKWHEQFVQPRYHDLFAKVPTFWEVDDHDYRIDDGDNTGDYAPSPETARRILMEQLPYAAADNDSAKTYRTHRVSKDLQIWFTENRMYRSPNDMEDGPGKSIWGTKQREWLQQTLLASDATFKLLVSPTPMIGPDSLHKTDNHTNIGGFQHERDSFFSWLVETGLDQKNFYIVCGDRHWQYHSLSSQGIEEFSCGALTDTNSRLGVNPGDPKSSDPEGLVRQPYTQSPRSGGFLLVKTQRDTNNGKAELTFDFRDEHGIQLYTHTKSGY